MKWIILYYWIFIFRFIPLFCEVMTKYSGKHWLLHSQLHPRGGLNCIRQFPKVMTSVTNVLLWLPEEPNILAIISSECRDNSPHLKVIQLHAPVRVSYLLMRMFEYYNSHICSDTKFMLCIPMTLPPICNTSFEKGQTKPLNQLNGQLPHNCIVTRFKIHSWTHYDCKHSWSWKRKQ